MHLYADALRSLLDRGAELTSRRKFELEHMRTLADALGSPQLRFPSILIAGTNGKGSTAATLAAILGACGLRTGLYTSPHLSRVNERIQIFDGPAPDAAKPASPVPVKGLPIGDDDFARLYFHVDYTAQSLVRESRLPYPPSFFEILTALAFLYFAQQKIQIAVLEVGLGGRLDATNIVTPLLSVITDISLDHTEWLGPDLPSITREKAGILRRHSRLVTLPQHPEVNQAIGEAVTMINANAVNAAIYIPSRADVPAFRNRYMLEIAGDPVLIDSPLAGQHQQRNIALAIATAVELRGYGYKIPASAIARGVAATDWPARLELFPAVAASKNARPEILLDVAHNPAGAWTLRAAISALESERASQSPDVAEDLPPFPQKTLLFGCLDDKPIDELAKILFPIFDRVILTAPDSPRATDPAKLAALAETLGTPSTVVPQPSAALDVALGSTPSTALLVIAGSLYLAGELRPQLLSEK
jgi:dihydrofolate synthase/folylpolyglutamate synthase